MFLVSLDYHVDEVMSYHIFLGEVNEFDTINSGDYSLGFDESRTAARRKVDLCYVSGNDRF